jgi:hypothetical protein
MVADNVEAGFGAFDHEGAFFCANLLVAEERSNSSTVGTSQRKERERHVRPYSDCASKIPREG